MAVLVQLLGSANASCETERVAIDEDFREAGEVKEVDANAEDTTVHLWVALLVSVRLQVRRVRRERTRAARCSSLNFRLFTRADQQVR